MVIWTGLVSGGALLLIYVQKKNHRTLDILTAKPGSAGSV
jgi:hypothetical protein